MHHFKYDFLNAKAQRHKVATNINYNDYPQSDLSNSRSLLGDRPCPVNRKTSEKSKEIPIV